MKLDEALQLYSDYMNNYTLLEEWLKMINTNDLVKATENIDWIRSNIDKIIHIEDKKNLLNNITTFVNKYNINNSYVLTKKENGKYDWNNILKNCYKIHSTGKHCEEEAKNIYQKTGKKIDCFHYKEFFFIDENKKMMHANYIGDLLDGKFVFREIDEYSDNYNICIFYLTNKLLTDIFNSLNIGKTRANVIELYTIKNYKTLFNIYTSLKLTEKNKEVKNDNLNSNFENALNKLLTNYEKFIVATNIIKNEVSIQGETIINKILQDFKPLIIEIMQDTPVITSWEFINYSEFQPHSHTNDLLCLDEIILPPHYDCTFIQSSSFGLYIDSSMNLWQGELHAEKEQEIYEMEFKPLSYIDYCHMKDSPITEFITNILFRLGEYNLKDAKDIEVKHITDKPESQLGLKIKTFIKACHTSNFNSDVIKLAKKMLIAIPQVNLPIDYFLSDNENKKILSKTNRK